MAPRTSPAKRTRKPRTPKPAVSTYSVAFTAADDATSVVEVDDLHLHLDAPATPGVSASVVKRLRALDGLTFDVSPDGA